MADPVSFPSPERDIEHALITLKKGSQLIKYCRKGKPKLRLFRLSTDETTLLWYSRGEERKLKLSSVSRIIAGQRTPVFRRYLRPEKDYLSFSLIYNNGERSLDLICKDKSEVEVWFSGLKALTSARPQQHLRTQSELPDIHGGDFFQNGISAALDLTSTIARPRTSVDSNCLFNLVSSDVGFERANMQLRGGGGDGFRISVSSTPSCSSGGSGQDDIESLGDVYVWGEVWCEGVLPDGSVSPFPTKIDVLAPKPLESNVVLDVQQIACGVRHVALVTRQGEVFTWGEESGGRLGHGAKKDFSRPHLVESLAVANVEFVACGEYHTCAVTTSGDVFTWGDGTHNTGVLGHGTEVSHWVPKRVSGPVDGLQVLSVACGTWHSALATSNGKLFTFGDGTYGVLGHGDRVSVLYPREVQLLNGLKTVKVACGVWHTAAIVEVMNQSGVSITSRKLFTWGDGEKHRLGHGNKDSYLLPNCVSSLIDYNFHQIACGHTMTVALTTSGHVFTTGGTAYGQLGNQSSDGKLPVLVQDKLVGEFVEEISCGAYHVAVLTSRSEVYTWGKGANGRLGHGDTEDRKTPTLVESLKDRHVKSISCGSNFTASICIHKWVSGVDQSVCTGCRQAFGFTRKRHNCYNCGLVHCHGCSSKKALKAALAPTPGKPHRVCDACYTKLKAAEASNTSINRKVSAPRRSIDIREYKGEVKSSRPLLCPVSDPVKYLEMKMGKSGMRSDSSMVRASQAPPLLPLKEIGLPSSLSSLQNAFKPVPTTSTPPPPVNPRPMSPYSRRPSPPRTAPGFSKNVIDSLKKTNECLSQEVSKLQNHVKSLKQRCDAQDGEIQKLLQEAVLLSAGGSSKSAAAKEVVKSITEQLREMTEKLPPEVVNSNAFKAMQKQAETFTFGKSASSSLSAEFESSSQISRAGDQLDAAGVAVLYQDGGNKPSVPSTREGVPQHSSGESTKSPETSKLVNEVEKEVSEHFEPGVWLICYQLRNGTKVFKRVKFSKRRFNEQQANEWWEANKERVLKRFVPPRSSTVSPSPSAGSSSTPVPHEENDD